jgi:hypothetical protein
MVALLSLNLEAGPRVNKITVAQQQLETAVVLLFQESEYAPVHTLAGAATQILEDVCSAKGIISESFSLFADYVCGDQLTKEGRDAKRRHRNFFKHADSDPEEIVRLPDPRFVEILIYQGIADLNKLGYHNTEILRSFYIWFLVQHPDSLEFDDPKMHRILSQIHNVIKDFSHANKLRFGLIMLRMQQQEIEEMQSLMAKLKKSTGADIMAILEMISSYR